MFGSAVSWLSKKQPMVSLLTSKAEYVVRYASTSSLSLMINLANLTSRSTVVPAAGAPLLYLFLHALRRSPCLAAPALLVARDLAAPASLGGSSAAVPSSRLRPAPPRSSATPPPTVVRPLDATNLSLGSVSQTELSYTTAH